MADPVDLARVRNDCIDPDRYRGEHYALRLADEVDSLRARLAEVEARQAALIESRDKAYRGEEDLATKLKAAEHLVGLLTDSLGKVRDRLAEVEAERAGERARWTEIVNEVMDERDAAVARAAHSDSALDEVVVDRQRLRDRLAKVEAERDELSTNAGRLFTQGIQHFNRAQAAEARLAKVEAERDALRDQEPCERVIPHQHCPGFDALRARLAEVEAERDTAKANGQAVYDRMAWLEARLAEIAKICDTASFSATAISRIHAIACGEGDRDHAADAVAAALAAEDPTVQQYIRRSGEGDR